MKYGERLPSPRSAGEGHRRWLPCGAMLLPLLGAAIFLSLTNGPNRITLRPTAGNYKPPVSSDPASYYVNCGADDDSCCKDFSAFIAPRYRPQPARQRTSASGKKCFSILLIILFNHPFYEHAPLLRRLYHKAFTKIVFYGPLEDIVWGVRGAPRGKDGSFLHITITQVTIEHPGYDGYMWMADDQVLNYPAVFPLVDPRKIWTERFKGGVSIFQNRTDWVWLAYHALPAIRAGYNCLPRMFFNRTKRLIGCEECVTFTMADFGYIPGRFVPAFRQLAYAFRRVFLEIAIPTALQIVAERRKDVQHLKKMKWLWFEKRYGDPLRFLTKETQLLHPVKVGRNIELAGRLLDIMTNYTLDYKPPKWLQC